MMQIQNRVSHFLKNKQKLLEINLGKNRLRNEGTRTIFTTHSEGFWTILILKDILYI